ncbi:MAG TPA: DinB family protein [Chthonomonadaceae bacterium]|nr:DinB family protein [Chthonomonadaceae bacterium]
MPSMQEFLVGATRKASADLEAALLRLPEDKRNWRPAETARTALDQYAECAILNGSTADVIVSRSFPTNYDFSAFTNAKDALAQNWDRAQALLKENTEKICSVIQAVPDADLNIEVQFPWGPMTLAQIIAYPLWNMSYHEGQINYIASLLG